MTLPISPGMGLRIAGVSQQGYSVRARTDIRKWECTITISKTSRYNPVCTELPAEWIGRIQAGKTHPDGQWGADGRGGRLLPSFGSPRIE